VLAPNLAVSGTALLALSSKPGTRQLQITNQGPGTLFYNTVPTGTASTLTTGNGTQVLTESLIPLGVIDPPTGFDVYVISGTNTVASVQTVPL
jgi:hypothetical protein